MYAQDLREISYGKPGAPHGVKSCRGMAPRSETAYALSSVPPGCGESKRECGVVSDVQKHDINMFHWGTPTSLGRQFGIGPAMVLFPPNYYRGF